MPSFKSLMKLLKPAEKMAPKIFGYADELAIHQKALQNIDRMSEQEAMSVFGVSKEQLKQAKANEIRSLMNEQQQLDKASNIIPDRRYELTPKPQMLAPDAEYKKFLEESSPNYSAKMPVTSSEELEATIPSMSLEELLKKSRSNK